MNDTYGHAAGDEALLAVTGALRGEVRSVDVVGRVGGDEFGVILTDTSLAGAETHARRISRALARLREPWVSLSIGISGLDASEPTSVQLLRDADRALYHVKGTGRDGIAATSAHGRADARRELTTLARGSFAGVARRRSRCSCPAASRAP